MNDLLRAYANVDVVDGTFSFFSELRIADGKIDGYVKPLFQDVDVYDREQDQKEGFFRKLWEKHRGRARAPAREPAARRGRHHRRSRRRRVEPRCQQPAGGGQPDRERVLRRDPARLPRPGRERGKAKQERRKDREEGQSDAQAPERAGQKGGSGRASIGPLG